MSEKDGGAAFPIDVDLFFPDAGISKTRRVGGMSLRDYFAAQVLANPELVTGDWGVGNERDLAHVAYVIADAMLKERAK